MNDVGCFILSLHCRHILMAVLNVVEHGTKELRKALVKNEMNKKGLNEIVCVMELNGAQILYKI